MLNVIAEIGKTVAAGGGGDVLQYLVPGRNSFKVLVGMNFDTRNKIVSFDLVKSTEQDGLSREVLKEFLFIPTEKGARPQFVITTPKLGYLLSQTMPNLKDFLSDGPLKKKLENVIDIFWVETGKPNDARYGRAVGPDYIKIVQVVFDIHSEDAKKAIAVYSASLEKAVAAKVNAKPKELLYTVKIDGESVAQNPEYRSIVLHKNLESAFESTEQQHCTTCGKFTDVSTDTTRFLLKFYMTDKINFASYFDAKNYNRAVTLCRDCYRDILVGERWIDANLKTSLGNFQVYLLPQILYSTFEDELILAKLQNLPDHFNATKNIEQLRARENDIQLYFQDVPFIFNLLFFRKAQAAFKILTLIKDVPPSRIAGMARAAAFVDDTAEKNTFPSACRFDLNQIYWLMPMKKKGADHVEYRKLLQTFDNLFNEYPFRPAQLYNLYCQLAHMHRAGTYHLYQFSKQGQPDWALKSDTLKWNLFLLFLKKLNLFHGGEYMQTTHLEEFYPTGLADLFADLQYDPAQQGLALLGYVLGAVANAQYKEGLENKPVLEKVNYQGMPDEKVIRLFNELFEKIRQYKRHIGYAERWWSAAKQLYESSDRSRLTANERVFYLLSGYSFHLLGSGTKNNSDNENENNNNE